MDVTVIVVNVLGWAGMALLVGAYALVTVSRIHATGLAFQLMNLVGGAFLMLNTAYYGAWPSTALNFTWICIGAFGLLRAAIRSGRVQDRRELLDPVDQAGAGAGPGSVGVDGVDRDARR
ncbi:hypothetical protein ABLE68_12665 [Nocardioides sp. CN2-186]|uniref:CBU_0592 family membrane protein n=1 Tax=Nocardioides tweenelious TaxID=3156607 RepID=UPI0032B5F0B9